MKKIIIIIALLLLTSPVYAQTEKTDLFAYIDGFEWTTTKHQHPFSDKGDYTVNGLQFAGYPCHATITKDPTRNRVMRITVEFDDKDAIKKERAKAFSNRMDNILISYFGNPDSTKDDPDGILSSNERVWYKEDYRVDFLHFYKGEDNIMCLLSIRGFDKNEPNFRKSFWGDSKSKVVSVEGQADKGYKSDIYYISDNVAGMPCNVMFSFTNGELSGGLYSFEQKHTNRNDYIGEFNKLVSLLTKKYGEPSENNPIWRNSLYKGDIEEYGFAISMGHLVYRAKWITPLTEIVLDLSGENSQIDLYLIYTSSRLEAKRVEAEENKDLIGL